MHVHCTRVHQGPGYRGPIAARRGLLRAEIRVTRGARGTRMIDALSRTAINHQQPSL